MLLLGGRKEEETYSGGRNPRALHPLYETKPCLLCIISCVIIMQGTYMLQHSYRKYNLLKLFALVNMIELQLVVEIERGLSLQPCCTTILK